MTASFSKNRLSLMVDYQFSIGVWSSKEMMVNHLQNFKRLSKLTVANSGYISHYSVVRLPLFGNYISEYIYIYLGWNLISLISQYELLNFVLKDLRIVLKLFVHGFVCKM